MPPTLARNSSTILYVASRLPELSETFVYREMLGLRARGRSIIGASIRTPSRFAADPQLEQLAAQAFVVYSPATVAALPFALIRHPALFARALGDAARADHPSFSSRLKHLYQAGMGIAAGWRLRGRGIGHVHAHMANVPTMVGLYIARTLGVPFSFTGHAADLFVQRAALAFKLDRASFVSCISHWHHGFYQDVTAKGPAALPVIRCSVAIPEAVQQERREIVTVARLVPKKGIDLLIRAFASRDCKGWTLRILGGGPERAALETLATELGVSDRVMFEGAQPHSTCLEAIRGAGLFVLPCRTAANGDKDGIPVVLMEAMAAARAVIAGDLPAIRELIEDGRSGLLVAPNDPQVLGSAIDRLIGDQALRGGLGGAARERVIEEFSDEVNLARLNAAIDAARATA